MISARACQSCEHHSLRKCWQPAAAALHSLHQVLRSSSSSSDQSCPRIRIHSGLHVGICWTQSKALSNLRIWPYRVAQLPAMHFEALRTAADRLCAVLQDTRSGDGRTSALSFLAKLLAGASPPVPPLDEALPSLLAPGLKTSLAVRSAVHMVCPPTRADCTNAKLCREASCGGRRLLMGFLHTGVQTAVQRAAHMHAAAVLPVLLS